MPLGPRARGCAPGATQLVRGDRRMVVALTAAAAIRDPKSRRAPRDSSVLHNLAVMYALTQQPEKSREVLATLQRLAPDHAGEKEGLRRRPSNRASGGVLACVATIVRRRTARRPLW